MRLAVDAELFLVGSRAELGREYHALASPPYRPADETFVVTRAIDVGSIDEIDAGFDRRLKGANRLCVVSRAIELRHAHASDAEG